MRHVSPAISRELSLAGASVTSPSPVLLPIIDMNSCMSISLYRGNDFLTQHNGVHVSPAYTYIKKRGLENVQVGCGSGWGSECRVAGV